jgi:hypothetical protein
VERRHFLKGLGIVVGGAGLGAAAGPLQHPKIQRIGRTPTPKPTAVGPAEKALLRELPEGSRLANKWRVEQIHGVTFGAIPIVLSSIDSGRFQIDIMRRDDETRGVASTEKLELFVANGGNGNKLTDEDHAEAAIAMAEVLARSESAAPRGLLTLRERHARHPDGYFAALV